MKCPVCVQEGERSKVYGGQSVSTAMGWQPYWDEDGRPHTHDPNVTRSTYGCDKGHRFRREFCMRCPTCGWQALSEKEEKLEILPPTVIQVG